LFSNLFDMSKEMDFSKMRFPIHTLKEAQDPFLVYDEFKKYNEFHQVLPLPRKKVLRYIIYVYDKNSPLAKMDLFRAKIKGAELAGFKKEDNKFPEMVENMIVCNVPSINDMIVRYLTLSNDIKFQKYAILKDVYFRISRALLSGEKENIKSLTDTEKEISSTVENMTMGEPAEKLLIRLSKYYLEEKVELRPEEIAIKLRQQPNELPC